MKYSSFEKQNHLLKLFKVLSNANRLKVLKFLSSIETGSATVGEIVAATGIKESNLSNHLKLMRISKVIRAKQSSTFMHYSINDPLVKTLISSILD